MQKLTWTRPYYGVQHLGGHDLLDNSPRATQVTVDDYNSFATLQCWKRDPIRGGLKSIGGDQKYDTVDLAKLAGETWFASLGVI